METDSRSDRGEQWERGTSDGKFCESMKLEKAARKCAEKAIGKDSS